MGKWIFRIIILVVVSAMAIYGWEKVRGIKDSFSKPDLQTTQQIVLEKITAMGKLELVKYQFKDIVEQVIERPILPNTKAAIIVSGEAIGCIELSNVSTGNIAIVNDSLVLTLPKPEICVYKVDHSKSKVYNIEFGFLQEGQIVDDAFRKAEEKIRTSALETGIIEQAEANASKLLPALLGNFTQRKVVIKFK